MPCREIESWTFSELVGAFLDLAITYLLLFASTLAYVASKFLALFGLSLPCPCNGLFCYPKSSRCWQKVLVDCPWQNVSSVQFSIRSRFPFNSIWDQHLNSQSNISSLGDGQNRDVKFGEATCGSFAEGSGKPGIKCAGVSKRFGEKVRVNCKGRVVLRKRMRHDLRHRRKGGVGDATVSLYDPLQSGAEEAPSGSSVSVSKMLICSDDDANRDDKISSGSSVLHNCDESSMDTGFPVSICHGFELSEPDDEGKQLEKSKSCVNKITRRAQQIDDDVNKTIRDLQQTLEEERTARAALSLELEKERSAAASAADEAMAMIFRLQEEKALIEMEARQNQRIMEEKSAYDFEEMNILKEIILRREREKHFSEMEVQAYRNIIFDNEQPDFDMLDTGSTNGKRPFSLANPDDNLLLRSSTSDSVIKKENLENVYKFFEDEIKSVKSANCILTLGSELSIPKLDKKDTKSCKQEINEKLEEKELITLEKNSFNQERERQSIEPSSQYNIQSTETLPENATATVGNPQYRGHCISESEGLNLELAKISKHTGTAPYSFNSFGTHGMDSLIDVHDHDVHVVDDGQFVSAICKNIKKDQSFDAAFDIPKAGGSPNVRRLETMPDTSRSCSDITIGLPPISRQSKSLLPDLRRNSMSAVDYERFKIDNEVGWLRERLKVIQEGREKLNISMGPYEKDNVQVKLLETILHQLQQIQHLTRTEKAVRRASLPHLSHKITSKKNSWRSVSLGK